MHQDPRPTVDTPVVETTAARQSVKVLVVWPTHVVSLAVSVTASARSARSCAQPGPTRWTSLWPNTSANECRRIRPNLHDMATTLQEVERLHPPAVWRSPSVRQSPTRAGLQQQQCRRWRGGAV